MAVAFQRTIPILRIFSVEKPNHGQRGLSTSDCRCGRHRNKVPPTDVQFPAIRRGKNLPVRFMYSR